MCIYLEIAFAFAAIKMELEIKLYLLLFLYFKDMYLVASVPFDNCVCSTAFSIHSFIHSLSNL